MQKKNLKNHDYARATRASERTVVSPFVAALVAGVAVEGGALLTSNLKAALQRVVRLR